MGIITSLIAVVLCCIVYVRMYKRDLPVPLKKWKAVLPIILGLISPFISTVIVLGFGLIFTSLGTSLDNLVPNIFLGSLLSSFLKAGFAEEITKFAILLIVVRLVKPKNVYEYGLLGAGVGFGFTGVEELLYGGSNPVVALIRIPSFGAHMMLGLIMGLCYGLAKFRKQNNLKGSGKYMAMSLLVPMAIHTVYDAVTVSNKELLSTNDNVIMAGVIVALLVLIFMVVLQFYSFYWFKKNSSELCEKTVGK